MNYPFFQQPYPQMPQNSFIPSRPTYMDVLQQAGNIYQGIRGKPVSSLEEAKMSMIDFDGSIFYFPDMANQKIYTKQINLDGTSSLKTYVLIPESNLQQTTQLPNNTQNISKEEFDSTILSLMEEIQNLKGAMIKNDESSTKQQSNVSNAKR